MGIPITNAMQRVWATEFAAGSPFRTRPNIRTIFDNNEGVALSRKTAALTVQGFAKVRDELRPGMSEMEVAQLFNQTVLQAGANALSYDTIVLSGPRSTLTTDKEKEHFGPSDRILKPGDMVVIDAGAAIYFNETMRWQINCDMTRTFVLGKPSDLQKTTYNLVLKAQRAALRKIKAGALARVIDHAARDLIASAGYYSYFTHPLGHGLAISPKNKIHSNPYIGNQSINRLFTNDIIAIEPGIYHRRGRFGVRIEDTLCVTDDGYELLSDFPKKLSDMIIPLSRWV